MMLSTLAPSAAACTPTTAERRAARTQQHADVARLCGDRLRARRLDRTANRLAMLAARLEAAGGEGD